MSIFTLRYDPDVKRLRTYVDLSYDIQWYTRNNCYPQICEAIRDRSYTIKSACNELSRFLKGQGFADQNIANMVVNSKGHTLNNILRYLAPDAAAFSGSYVLHLGVNRLGEYNNLSVWPFAYWRMGLPDDNGDVWDYKYNSNWEQDPYKEVDKSIQILTYPRFNPDKEAILEQIAEYEENGVPYPGQVLYVTPIDDQYPMSTFDQVLDQGQTQEEIGLFRLASIQNGLNAGSVFSYPGKFEDDAKAIQFKESLNEYKGGKGAGSIIVIEDESGQKKAADLVTPLTMLNNDKIHEFISKDDKNAIVESFNMPKGLLGIMPESGMFNQENLKQEYSHYNQKTSDDRAQISETFKKVFANWYQPIQSDFKILELAYESVAAPSKPVIA